ncbi:MAG: transposase family protein, partial [Chloroflexi bacterium]|nr:transposase family protein [Chloroflexota bacterium]
MVSEEKMTVDERYKYLRMVHRRYDSASREERGRLLDEAAAVTGLERKYLCHLLNKEGPIRKKRVRHRCVVYDGEVKRTVRIVADALDWICAERLQPTLAQTAIHLASFGELEVNQVLVAKLEEISISSVARLLKDLRKGEPRLPQRRGRPQGDGVSADIPMTRLAWDISEPGHFEIDLVHHCGPSARDDYVCTMQWIDVATGWSERVAVYGRSAREMKAAFTKVVSRCPFPILEIHPDNGSEFMNRPLLDFFGQIVTGVKLTRSRPYHKNDNRFVEQ